MNKNAKKLNELLGMTKSTAKTSKSKNSNKKPIPKANPFKNPMMDNPIIGGLLKKTNKTNIKKKTVTKKTSKKVKSKC